MGPEGHGEVAYILKGYPRLSESFIANEIFLLESLGQRLRVFAVTRGDAGRMQPVVARIAAPVHYLPEVTSLSASGLVRWLIDNFGKFAAVHRDLAALRPAAYLRTLAAALLMVLRYRGAPAAPRTIFIKEFLQAGAIALPVLKGGSVRHLHGHFCHGAATITWFVSRLTGIPFSFTAHAKDIYQGDLNPGDLLDRKLAAARFVVTCTGANRDYLAPRAPAGRVHLVYHGLDLEFFRPLAERPAPAVPLILGVGRLVEKKGFHQLVAACALLRDWGIAFRCLIVGGRGDQSARIARMIADLDLAEAVAVQEPVTHDVLHGLYARASVFALPCEVLENGDRDGIPNTLAEAMAMGLAVVSTAISGIPELVDDGVDGLLVPAGDAAALAGALRRLLHDAGLRRRLGGAARHKVRNRFDSLRTTRDLRDLFAEALEATGAAAGVPASASLREKSE